MSFLQKNKINYTFPTLIWFPLTTQQCVSPHKLYLEGCWAYFKMAFSVCGIKYMSSACSPHYTFSPQWPHSQWRTWWGWHFGKATAGFKFQKRGQKGVKRFTPLSQQRDVVKTENLFLSFHWCSFSLIDMVFEYTFGNDSNHGRRFKYSYQHAVEF